MLSPIPPFWLKPLFEFMCLRPFEGMCVDAQRQGLLLHKF